jgi:uncharacterized protein (DUF952 family)
MTKVYKILTRAEWDEALGRGRFEGSALDRRDGFIHLSTAAQAEETARRHFAGQADLVLVGLDAAALGSALAWEPSRGGALFPHLYGAIDPLLVETTQALALDAEGVPELGPLAP